MNEFMDRNKKKMFSVSILKIEFFYKISFLDSSFPLFFREKKEKRFQTKKKINFTDFVFFKKSSYNFFIEEKFISALNCLIFFRGEGPFPFF